MKTILINIEDKKELIKIIVETLGKFEDVKVVIADTKIIPQIANNFDLVIIDKNKLQYLDGSQEFETLLIDETANKSEIIEALSENGVSNYCVNANSQSLFILFNGFLG